MSDQSLENAVRFISDTLKNNPSADRLALIEEAGRKFDLSPIQTENLVNKYVMGK